MTASNDSTATARPRPTYANEREIGEFVEMLGRFERGEIGADAWRAYRVVRGAYGQRQGGVHMLRVKIPQGIADADQLRALAEVSARFSRGFGHVTTRQNYQVHFLRPSDLEPAMRRLARAGLTTLGAGGNAVRNVVACPLSGVARGEAFDVTPYAEAVTRHFLRHPLASALPRKFKIAFEGCPEDHVATAIQDLGFRARLAVVNGVEARGFSVTVAGGTSSLCTSGHTLVELLPAGEVLAVAEAVVRVFHARGDRINKQRNRLKFLVRQLGFETFRALFEEELARVREEGAPRLPFDPTGLPEERAPAHARPAPPEPRDIAARIAAAPPRGPGEPPAVESVLAPAPGALARFTDANVRPQRQPGFSIVTAVLPQGDITAAQLEIAAELALSLADGTVRFTPGGHLLFRWVPTAEVPALFARLAAAGLGRTGASSAADVLACPGADACRLAITHTRCVARLVGEEVRTLGDDALSAALPVRVSGCPNGCSQHHLAAIGLQGSARRLGARTIPQYAVLVGGGSGDAARFAAVAGKVPARRAPEVVRRLVALYLSERRGEEDAGAFFARALDRARAIVAPFEPLRPEQLSPEDLVEPGSPEEFGPDVQESECAA
jgi:sulfite reductase (NADPH) hemoprotein beta-component